MERHQETYIKEVKSRLIKYFSIIICILVLITIFFNFFFINSTRSLPLGIYKKETYKSMPSYGDYVSFKLNKEDFNTFLIERGLVKNTNFYYLKKVAGLPGDVFETKRENVLGKDMLVLYRNNKKLMIVREFDGFNRPMIHVEGRFKLKEDEIFVLGENVEHSLDSRYFGAIKIKDIFGYSSPFLTF